MGANKKPMRACVDGAGVGFMYAPTFHPALGNLVPIRRALGFRTIFNVLGPLANPALVRRALIGVAQAHLLDAMAEVLLARGALHCVLVHADDGLDELSLGTPSSLHVIRPEGITVRDIDAGGELGLHHSAASIRGGDVTENVSVVRAFLEGHPGAVFDVACANAGLALVVAERAQTLREGFDLAAASVRDGRAAQALERLVEISNS